MTKTDVSRQAKYFLIFLIFVFGYFIYLVYSNFLFNIMIASLLVLGTLNMYDKINSYFNHNVLSSVVSTLILVVFFFFPIFYFITHLTIFISHIHIDALQGIIGSVNSLISDLALTFNLQDFDIKKYTSSINPSDVVSRILDFSKTLANIGVSFVTDVTIVSIFYFILLIYKNDIEVYFKNLIPLANDDKTKLINTLSSTMSIVYSSTLLTAILEGFLFAIIVMFYGYDAFLLGMLYSFASLIPVIGGLIVWLPIALYEFSIGQTTNAIVISVYTIVVISIISDTFIKPLIIAKIKNSIKVNIDYSIDPYIIFFAILAGMTSFGFWGIIIGPAVTTIFLTLLFIYSTNTYNDRIYKE